MLALALVLWTLVALGTALLAYGSIVEARRVRTDHLRVTLPRLPEGLAGLRIVHLADTHCRPGAFYAPLFEGMVEAANAAAPDLILLSGDLAAGAERMGEAAAWLGRLRAPLGVIAVLGNHDLNITMERWLLGLEQGFDIEDIRATMAAAGVVLLHNESLAIEARGHRLVILGIGDPSSGLDDLPGTAASAPSGDLTLLLTHSPDILDCPGLEVADLVLCGHTHAGQMILPGLGPVWAPVWRDRRRGEGLLATGDVAVHVTRGVGTSWPVRLGCPPQVAVLELHPGPLGGRRVPSVLTQGRPAELAATHQGEAQGGGEG